MTEILDEISEDLKQQKLNQFWQENKYWVIGGIVGSILLTGSISFWKNWEYQRDTKATSELTSLVRNISDKPEALENFANTTDKKHALIAKFILANDYISKDKTEEALNLYKSIAETKGINNLYRDLAKVLSISRRMDIDSAEKLRAELTPLMDGKSAWHYTVLELDALLYAKEQNLSAAIDALGKITNDNEAPNDIRNRALTLKELYTAEQNKS